MRRPLSSTYLLLNHSLNMPTSQNTFFTFAILICVLTHLPANNAWSVGQHSSSLSFSTQSPPTRTTLFAKSKSRMRQRDALEWIKKQRDASVPESPEAIKERNDRLRFDELLKTKGFVVNDFSSDGYLNKRQEEEEINAAVAGVDRIFEGDPAPVQCFEELVSIYTENALGEKGAQRFIPWLRKNADPRTDYQIVFCDPRSKSTDLYAAVKHLLSELPKDILKRFVVVNADSPAENRRWLKKSELEGKVEVFSDEKMEFMRTYTALGEKRWSMTMFIIVNERVLRIAREVDKYAASKTIQNAVKSLAEKRL